MSLRGSDGSLGYKGYKGMCLECVDFFDVDEYVMVCVVVCEVGVIGGGVDGLVLCFIGLVVDVDGGDGV